MEYLVSIGLRQDEICNMAVISYVLLGLNPETRLAPVVEYLKNRGMPGAGQEVGVGWGALRPWLTTSRFSGKICLMPTSLNFL